MLARTSQCLHRGSALRLVVYGDSISEVGRTPNYFGGASCAAANWGSQVGQRLGAAWPRATVEVRHFGIGGQNSYEALGRLDWLAPLAPDLVLVAFGANDSGYHYIPPDATGFALRSLVAGIRARHGADVVVVGEGGGNPLACSWLHPDETLAAVRAAAAACAVPLADVRPAMLAATDQGRRWAAYHHSATDCHPNDAGHALWAKVVFEVIQQNVGRGQRQRGQA